MNAAKPVRLNRPRLAIESENLRVPYKFYSLYYHPDVKWMSCGCQVGLLKGTERIISVFLHIPVGQHPLFLEETDA